MALLDALNMDGAAGTGNIIDINAIGLGAADHIKASDIEGLGPNSTIIGLGAGQTLIFNDANGAGTYYDGITVEGDGAHIMVADGVDMSDFTIAASTLGLTVAEQGNITGLHAQSAHVIDLDIQGRVSGADFGEASFTGSSLIAGTLANSSLRDANVAEMRVSGYLDNVDITGLTGNISFGRAAGLSGIYTARDGARTDFISTDQIEQSGLHVSAPAGGLSVGLSEAGAAYLAAMQSAKAPVTTQHVAGIGADVLQALRSISGGLDANPLTGEAAALGVVSAEAQALADAAKAAANENARSQN